MCADCCTGATFLKFWENGRWASASDCLSTFPSPAFGFLADCRAHDLYMRNLRDSEHNPASDVDAKATLRTTDPDASEKTGVTTPVFLHLRPDSRHRWSSRQPRRPYSSAVSMFPVLCSDACIAPLSTTSIACARARCLLTARVRRSASFGLSVESAIPARTWACWR